MINIMSIQKLNYLMPFTWLYMSVYIIDMASNMQLVKDEGFGKYQKDKGKL